jgi:hypothetical protein
VLLKLSQLLSSGTKIKSFSVDVRSKFVFDSFLNWAWLGWNQRILIVVFDFDASLEPIGSVAPKVGSGDDLKSVKTEQGKSSTLLCSAQAYPTPVFR